MMNINSRDVLLTLSMNEEGQWMSVFKDIKGKRPLAKEEVDKAYQENKACFVTICDADYPEYFKARTNPPFLLYYYGNKSLFNAKYRLTVVGTRQPTIYQTDTVYRLIKEVEEALNNEVAIVSGMAAGLDQISMKAAMSVKAPIISVIGSGIENPYPSDNDGIYDYCKSGKGLVISEYPGKVSAKPENFLFRNRLLSSLSEVMFVAGGKNRSGTSSSVRLALEDNREILALPCDITGDDLTNSLISDGALSVLSASDLVNSLKERYNLQ